MTAGQAPGADDLRGAPLEPCPCGHGDVAAEMERQRPLISRAIQGDPEALGVLYDDHVDDVYRYLLAWTWDSAAARELTGQVFRGAVTWLPAIAEGKGDLGAWLIALARDAEGQQRGAAWAGQVQAQPQDAFDAVEQLDDAQREVVVLRLLLGHSIAHTAHLAGYDPRVVQELQLAACATISQLLGGAPLDPPPDPDGREDLRPRWFERSLAGAAMDADADPGLASALSIADVLRQGAADHVPPPEDGFVTHLRGELLQSIAGDLEGAPPAPAGRLRRAFALVRFHVARRPWAATTLAAGAIGLVLGVQLAGGSPARSTCTGKSCVTSGSTPTGVTRPTRSTSPTATTQPPLDLLTDPNLRGLAARAFDQVVRGKIAFNQPTSVRVGEPARIEARIAKTSAKELTEGFLGTGAVQVKDVEVSPFLRVVLLGNAFEIEPLSTEDQLLLNDGYTQWQWSVVPKNSGTQYLFLRVTLRLDIPNHGTEFLDRTVLTQPLQVAVNPIFMAKQFTAANWQWVFGTATPAAVVVGIVSYIRRRRRSADSGDVVA